MMDGDTIQFITNQNKELKGDLKDIIEANGTAVRGKIEAEADRMDKRFIPIEKDVKILKRETRISRWAHRNPRVAIVGFILAMAVLMIGLHTLNVKRTVEKVLRIELNE